MSVPVPPVDAVADLPRECYAVVHSAARNRKRFPESCVKVVASEDEARAGIDEARKLVAAVVFGPSRSSEGFRLFYLVRWIE